MWGYYVVQIALYKGNSLEITQIAQERKEKRVANVEKARPIIALACWIPGDITRTIMISFFSKIKRASYFS